MTDPEPTPEPTREPTAEPSPELGTSAPPTGVALVDDVLAGLGGVEGQPVEDRVPAFERAQEGLRAALTDDPAPADPAPGDPAPGDPAPADPDGA